MKNLVLEGGGVKGVAYAGVFQALNDVNKLDSVESVLGISAGSIAALFLAIGMRPKEIAEALFNIDFSDFKDDSFGLIRDGYRFISKYGKNRGDAFSVWLDDIVYAYTGIKDLTFEQLQNQVGSKNLYIGACCLNTGSLEIFSHETSPKMSVSKAVRMSMSIPFFFVPVKYAGKYYVDGGLLNNYPIDFFDINYNSDETLGIRLDNTSEIEDRSFNYGIDNLVEYSMAIFSTVYDNLQASHMTKKDWNRTLVIDCGEVGATDFGIDETNKHRLIQSGWLTTLKRYSSNIK